jgi:microcin C transport system permease protein
MARAPTTWFSPLTRKRWQAFRRHRRAWFCFRALAAVFALGLCPELISNDRPLLLRAHGRWFLPAFRRYTQDDLLGNGSAAPADYRACTADAAFRADPGGFVLYAPFRHGPREVMDPAAFEPFRERVVRIVPETLLGRFNLAADGTVARPEECAAFFPGAGEIRGLAFADHWVAPPAFAAAVADRLANRASPAAAFALASRTNPAWRVSAELAAYEPRAAPPSGVRVLLRAESRAAPVTLRFDGRGRPLSGRAWRGLTAPERALVGACVADANAAAGEAVRAVTWRGVPARATTTAPPVSWPHRPVPGHRMGVDSNGYDVLARVIYGLRTALLFGVLMVAWATLLGLAIGALQGYFGGWLDILGQRGIEIWSALPFLYVMILIGAVLGRSFLLLLVCYGLFNWIGLSYYMRAEFLRLRHRPFVEAARCQGLGHARIIFRHILPNSLTPLITLLPFSLVGAIGVLTALDFLGFGLPPLAPSWGELVQQAQQARWAWWLVVFPTAALFVVMLLTALVGEGLREAFDPRPKARLEG